MLLFYRLGVRNRFPRFSAIVSVTFFKIMFYIWYAISTTVYFLYLYSSRNYQLTLTFKNKNPLPETLELPKLVTIHLSHILDFLQICTHIFHWRMDQGKSKRLKTIECNWYRVDYFFFSKLTFVNLTQSGFVWSNLYGPFKIKSLIYL